MKTEFTYRNIFKSTALLGGVQMVTLLLNIIRGKVVATLLGAAGMGIMSLYTMVSNLVLQFTGLGFNVSGVREIAAAQNPSAKIKAMRRMNVIAAAAGMVFMLTTAPWLSIATFGTDSYTVGFMTMGAFVFTNTLAMCESAVLQGSRRIKSVAFCNVMSAILGLIVGIPFYCIKGEQGIVPALCISSLLYYAVTRWESSKIALKDVEMTWRSCWSEGKPVLILGLSMTMGYVLGAIANYLVSGGVRYMGSISDVGLYSAAITITSQYGALVFTAIATDFLPKLSAVADKHHDSFVLINKQTDIIVLIVAPITAFVIILSPIIIRLLLTEEFLHIVTLVRWLAFTTFIQACYFPLGYMLIASGDKRMYFWIECVLTNVKTPLLLLVGYYVWGLWGLGYASVFNAVIDFFITIAVMRWRYDMTTSWRTTWLMVTMAVMVLGCFCASFLEELWMAYTLMAIMCAATTTYSVRELFKRVKLR